MVVAAQAFLDSLSPEFRIEATLPFDGEDRFRWHYFPQEMFARKGVNIKQMSDTQRKAAHALLRSALSAQGYLKATHIMQLETVLGAIERARDGRGMDRDPELYWLMFFGAPSREKPWGWRAEGHHLSLSFIAVGRDLIATTPAFMGSNPAEVPGGANAGLRILGAEEELARGLILSLDDDQRSEAMIMSAAPQDIITKASRDITLQSPVGLPASEMTQAQRRALWQLIAEYVQNMRSDMAHRQLERIEHAGIHKIHFAWAGSMERGSGHYYRLHGPVSLIEYDNTQNNANHIHTVWRDLEDDFGGDMLRKHYEESEHHGNT